MNKSDLIDAIAADTEQTKTSVNAIIDSLFKTVGKTLKKGEDITLVGFGTFSLRKRAARAGRNPQTGEAIKIKASKNPAFKAGKGLKDAVK